MTLAFEQWGLSTSSFSCCFLLVLHHLHLPPLPPIPPPCRPPRFLSPPLHLLLPLCLLRLQLLLFPLFLLLLLPSTALCCLLRCVFFICLLFSHRCPVMVCVLIGACRGSGVIVWTGSGPRSADRRGPAVSGQKWSCPASSFVLVGHRGTLRQR